VITSKRTQSVNSTKEATSSYGSPNVDIKRST